MNSFLFVVDGVVVVVIGRKMWWVWWWDTRQVEAMFVRAIIAEEKYIKSSTLILWHTTRLYYHFLRFFRYQTRNRRKKKSEMDFWHLIDIHHWILVCYFFHLLPLLFDRLYIRNRIRTPMECYEDTAIYCGFSWKKITAICCQNNWHVWWHVVWNILGGKTILSIVQDSSCSREQRATNF